MGWHQREPEVGGHGADTSEGHGNEMLRDCIRLAELHGQQGGVEEQLGGVDEQEGGHNYG